MKLEQGFRYNDSNGILNVKKYEDVLELFWALWDSSSCKYEFWEFLNNFSHAKEVQGMKSTEIYVWLLQDLWKRFLRQLLLSYYYPLLTPVLILIEHSWYRVIKLSYNLAINSLIAIVLLLSQSWNQKVWHDIETLSLVDKEKWRYVNLTKFAVLNAVIDKRT